MDQGEHHAQPDSSYNQLPTEFRLRHTQPTQPNLVYPPFQLFRHESADINGSNQNSTPNFSPVTATTVSAPTAEISSAASETPVFSESRSGFFCFSIGMGTPLPYGMSEYFTEQIRQKDRVIESLLKQLQNRYVSAPPSVVASPSDTTNQTICDSRTNSQGRGRSLWFKESSENDQGGDEGGEDTGTDVNTDVLPIAGAALGLITDSSLNPSRHGAQNREPEDLDESDVGVANMAYLEPGPAIDLTMHAHLLEHSAPELLMHGIVVWEDVKKLFEIFHTNLNPLISLLDPVLHTPTSTFVRCPVLFTVVCAVSSRHYTEKSEIYPIAMQFAKRSVANALNEHRKTIELCQAYLLLSIYALPVPKWEQDCSWLFAGVAVQLATELNLHQEPISTAARADEKWERELLNRTRVWMVCFTMDHFIATQSGKPPAIKPDYIMRSRSNDWYSRSPYNSVVIRPTPVCNHRAPANYRRLPRSDLFTVWFEPGETFNRFIHSNIDGPPQDVDFRTVTIVHEAKLGAFSDEWAYRLAQQSNAIDLASTWQIKSFAFLTAYSQLFMFSFALEQAYRTGFQSMDELLFTKCLESAKNVLRSIIDGSGSTGFMRYCPHGHFTIVAFASAVLLKLLRPEFSHFMPGYEETRVYSLITQVIQTLSSSAVDDRHIPKLYAHFLDGLLSHHHRDSSALGHFHRQQPILRSIGGPSSSNYGDLSPASSMFTMSSFFGGRDWSPFRARNL
ncbi:Protein priB [Mycena sanguinolenta]|uniref:Protein priB n=1 Tax=Mycena sanguinolenta TaxID=230812 RepID=A0A8H6Z5N1_9AGAR|nr:Protein priB [Mycena sanguinolenta]